MSAFNCRANNDWSHAPGCIDSKNAIYQTLSAGGSKPRGLAKESPRYGKVLAPIDQ